MMKERKNSIKVSKVLTLKKEFRLFKQKLKEQEYRLIFTLDVIRSMKISIGILECMVWLYLAQIGWSNLYSIFRIFIDDQSLRATMNDLGTALFFMLLIVLVIMQAIKLAVSVQSIGYGTVLIPMERGIKSICKQGTIIFLVAVYFNEIEFADYYYLTTKLGVFGILFLLASFFETMTFRKIEKQVQHEISKEEFCLQTPYGELKNVSLNMFILNSKWEKYLYRSKKVPRIGSFNSNIQDCLMDTGAIANGEVMVLKDVFGDYEIALFEQSEVRMVAQDEGI